MEKTIEQNEKSPLPMAALDGATVKKIREAKKLTQLYVANVVGVTTDTISRWENNRYPSIKRENAEKLASALEVELADILRQEEPVEIIEEPPPTEKKGNRRITFMMFFAIGVIVMVGIIYSRLLVATPVAVRWLPHFGAPGKIIPVQIKVSRNESGTKGVIIKERLPQGWRLVNAIPPHAAGEATADEIKWLIPEGTSPVTISYTVQVPADAPLKTDASFAGRAMVYVGGIARKENISGDKTVKVEGVHWADKNGDGVIDDNEIMPAYYLTEELKGLGLDWKGIETIWSGKGYRWDPEKKNFLVVK